MPHAVTKKLVIGPVARVDDHLARRRVHSAALYSGTSRRQRRALGAVNNFKHLFHFVCGFSQDKGPRYVGSVPFYFATSIHQDNGSFANHLWRYRPVWKSRELAHLNVRAARKSQLAVRRSDQVLNLLLCHFFLHRSIRSLIGGESDLGCQPHELNLMIALDHPASGGYRRGAHHARLRRSTRDAGVRAAHLPRRAVAVSPIAP